MFLAETNLPKSLICRERHGKINSPNSPISPRDLASRRDRSPRSSVARVRHQPIAPRATRRGTGLLNSGNTTEITMPFDIVTLRPTGTTAQHLTEALGRATAAQAEQSAEFQRLQQQRDDLLLDGSAAAMAKADATLAASRDLAEKIASIITQLKARLATAEEAEAVANVRSLLDQFQASDTALSAWWTKMRVKLAAELTAGVELLNTTNDARNDHDRAAAAATERYPDQTFQQVKLAPVYGYSWLRDLESSASAADIYPDAFSTLITAGDPKPAGTF